MSAHRHSADQGVLAHPPENPQPPFPLSSPAGEIITMEESRELVRLEIIVEKGLHTFTEVGEALAEIRDRKLYRIEHETFADYCKVKWHMSDRRARQLMDASEVVGEIAKSGTMVPVSERQARELTKLPREKRAATWNAAVAASTTGRPTAKDVQAVVLGQASKPANKRAGEPPGNGTAPLEGMTWLQTATYAYGQLKADERKAFKNFQAGMEGGT
jgi:hypothetical protein